MKTLAPRAHWDSLRRSLVYVLPWSAAMNAFRLADDLLRVDTGRWVAANVLSMALWAWYGGVLAVAATALEPRLNRHWKLLLALGGVAIALSPTNLALNAMSSRWGLPTASYQIVEELLSSDGLFFQIWVLLFQGGMFMGACVLMARAERHRHAFAQAQIARSRGEALLAAAQLDALRERVEPSFLLRVMTAVQAQCVDDAPAADRLLDRLIVFLRGEMPGVRGGASTLASQLALALSYSQLGAALNDAPCRWTIAAPQPVPELPLPPFLLLPLMDRLGESAGSAATGSLRVIHDAGRVRIVFALRATDRQPTLPETLLYRVQVALRAQFGDAAQISIAPNLAQPDALLMLDIDLRALRCGGALPAALSADPAPVAHLSGVLL